jgi:hypothetical protein
MASHETNWISVVIVDRWRDIRPARQRDQPQDPV